MLLPVAGESVGSAIGCPAHQKMPESYRRNGFTKSATGLNG
jgi:hypothetical protein